MKKQIMLVGIFAGLSTPLAAQNGEWIATPNAVPAATGQVQAETTAAAQAEQSAPVAQKVASAAMEQIILPPNSEIMLTVPELVSSKKVKEGDSFQIKTMFDVMQNGVVVIPKGTYGDAKVTWRTGKGAFGKSAKIDVTYESLNLGDGRKLALTGTHRQAGQGNTGATLGAVAAAGLIGGVFVTGKSAEIQPGQQLLARTGEAMTFEIAVGTPRVVTARVAEQVVATPVAAEAAQADEGE